MTVITNEILPTHLCTGAIWDISLALGVCMLFSRNWHLSDLAGEHINTGYPCADNMPTMILDYWHQGCKQEIYSMVWLERNL